MTPEELKEALEAKGYEVRNIRVFKNSFHVNYWTSEVKMVRYCKCPIEKVELKDIRRW